MLWVNLCIFFLANKLNSKGNEVILITFLPIRCFEFHANFWKFRSQNGCAFPTRLCLNLGGVEVAFVLYTYQYLTIRTWG